MESLLQLHVVIPEEVPDNPDIEIKGGVDNVLNLVSEYFVTPNEHPLYDHLGATISSSLFERRPDNMEDVAEIERQLEEWYPDASVYWSSYDQTFGEMRSPADPSVNIMLLVTNWGIEEPSIRWKLQKETLQAPPLVLDDEIFHGTKDGVFAIDSTSGDYLWESEVGHMVQVPVGNENRIIGNAANEIVSLSRATGEAQWRTEFDIDNEEIIDSRVALGADNAYVGVRTGEVTALDLDTGERRALCECDDPVVSLEIIEPGLVVTTNTGARYLVDSLGKTEWPPNADANPTIKHSHDGRLYGTAGDSLLAMTEETGAIEWQVDVPPVNENVQFSEINDIVQIGQTVYVCANGGLMAVNAETGDRIWDYNPPEEFEMESEPVMVNEVVACVSSRRVVDEEYYQFNQNILHIIDPTDGSEVQRFELGVGDCYGPASTGDSIVVSAGGEIICVENFPDAG